MGREINRKKRQSFLRSLTEVTCFVEKAAWATGNKPCWKEYLTSGLHSLIPWRSTVILSYFFSSLHFHIFLNMCIYLFILFCISVQPLFLPFPSAWSIGCFSSTGVPKIPWLGCSNEATINSRICNLFIFFYRVLEQASGERYKWWMQVNNTGVWGKLHYDGTAIMGIKTTEACGEAPAIS